MSDFLRTFIFSSPPKKESYYIPSVLAADAPDADATRDIILDPRQGRSADGCAVLWSAESHVVCFRDELALSLLYYYYVEYFTLLLRERQTLARVASIIHPGLVSRCGLFKVSSSGRRRLTNGLSLPLPFLFVTERGRRRCNNGGFHHAGHSLLQCLPALVLLVY